MRRRQILAAQTARAKEAINAKQITEAGALDGSLRARSEVRQVPAEKGRARVQSGGQGDRHPEVQKEARPVTAQPCPYCGKVIGRGRVGHIAGCKKRLAS